jgi:hypothetical protein
MNLFVKFPDYWYWSSLMKVYTGVEQVESLVVYRLLHKVLGSAPAIILTITSCNMKSYQLMEELTQKIIPYFITEWKYT